MDRPRGQPPSSAFGDALRVKGSTCNYLLCDLVSVATRMPSGSRSVAEHCRGRPESCLAEGNGRKGRDRVAGEPAPGERGDGPEARHGPHGRGGHLRDDDGADDIYWNTPPARWAALEPSSAGLESSHDGVIDDDARCVISEIEPLPHSGAHAIGIAGIGRDGVDLGAGTGQGAREVAEAVQSCAPPGLPGSRPRRSDVPRPVQGQAPRRPVEACGRLSTEPGPAAPRRGQRSCFLGRAGSPRSLARHGCRSFASTASDSGSGR